MSSKSPFDSPDVCAILDIFYDERPTPEDEPDWAAIESRLFATNAGMYGLALNLLKAVWLTYEDPQSSLSRLWAEKNGLV